MEYSEYVELVGNMPEKWYTDEDLERYVKQAFLNELKLIAKDFDIEVIEDKDVQKLYELLADKSGNSIEAIEKDIAEAAHFMGRLFLFDSKFPHVVSSFPTNEMDQHVFAPVILAKILNISQDEAVEVASVYWGVPTQDGKLLIYQNIEE